MKEKNNSEYEISDSDQNSSSFQNSDCVKKQKKIKLKLKKQRIYKQKSHGTWSDEQELRFVNYMKEHRKIFEDKQSRRSNKIFRRMSKFVFSRSSQQCRSHHQKYEIRYQKFDEIILAIQRKLVQSLGKQRISWNKLEQKNILHSLDMEAFRRSHARMSSHLSSEKQLQNQKQRKKTRAYNDDILEQTVDYLITRKKGEKLHFNIFLKI